MATNIQTAIPEFITNANILKSFIEDDVDVIPKTGLRTLEYYTTLLQGGMSLYVAGIAYTAGQFSFTLDANEVKFWQASENITLSANNLDTTKWTARAVFGASSGQSVGGIALYSTGSSYSVGDVVIRIVDNFARLYQASATISSAPAVFRPQDWVDVTQTDTASITLKAYAETITGGAIVTGSVSSGVYSNPSNIGKQYVGTTTISAGQPVPTNSSDYVWEEIPGRIRVELADFGTAGTAVLGNKTLSESLDNFTGIEITAFDFTNSSYSTKLISMDVFRVYRQTVSSQHFGGVGGDEGITIGFVNNTTITLARLLENRLLKITGVR